jgi:hypothetical protein
MTKPSSYLRLGRYRLLDDDRCSDPKGCLLSSPVKVDKPIFRDAGSAQTGFTSGITPSSSSLSSSSMPPPLDADPTITSSYVEEELPTIEEKNHQTLLIHDILREREKIKAENERLAAKLREAEEALQKLSIQNDKRMQTPSPAGLLQAATFDDSTITTATSGKQGFLRRTGTYDSASESSPNIYPINRTGTWESGYGVPVDASGVPSRIKCSFPSNDAVLDAVVEEDKFKGKKKKKFFILVGRTKKKSLQTKGLDGKHEGDVASKASSIFKK